MSDDVTDEWYENELKLLPEQKFQDYVLLAASLLGLVAVFLYVYNLVADRDGTGEYDDDEDWGDVNDENENGVPAPRTKRLTKEERKALRRLHASTSTGTTRKRTAVRLDADALTSRMWHLPLTSTQDEALSHEDAVRRLLVGSGGMHVETLADRVGINVYQALAAIKGCEKKKELRGYLQGDGAYRVLCPEDVERFHARVAAANEPMTLDELHALMSTAST
jgi:hypothetical protein